MSDQNEIRNNDTPEIGDQSELEELETDQITAESLAIIETLHQELEDARAKVDEYLDGWQRSRAEFTNYKKRVERDALQTYQQAAGSILRRFLDIADDLEIALKNRPSRGEGAAWANGIELIYRKLLVLMENEGITPVQAEGVQFDPTFHEAVISEESSEYESGQVIEVLHQGYMLGDKVLRPARVRVAR